MRVYGWRCCAPAPRDPVRIGVLTTSYPRGPGDPAGAFVRDRVQALIRDGAEVEVLAAGPGDGCPGVERIPSSLFYSGGAPEELETGGFAVWEAASFLARFAAAARARVHRWDVIESHWLVPSALVASSIAGRRPQRAFAHGGDVALLERLPGGGALAHHLATRGIAFTFVSEGLRRRFARLAGIDVPATIEPVPVDTALFRPGTRHVQRPTVLGVGRLVPIKGFDLLIRAVAALPDRPGVVLLGDGPERGRLVALAARRGVTLVLPGVVPAAEVRAWMDAVELLAHPCRVLPSGRVEGMPLAVREALAVGLPVVACASGGLTELAGAPGLTLIPPDDLIALVRALSAQRRTQLSASRCEAPVTSKPPSA